MANHQMDLINQIVRQQIVPERSAPGNQHVFAWLAFEFGNLLMSICTSDDGDIRPGSCQRVRDDDGGHGRARLAELSLFGGPLLRGGILSDLWPETVE